MVLIITLIIPAGVFAAPQTASAEAQTITPGEVPAGLTSAEWGSIQDAVAEAEYHFTYHEATEEFALPYYWAPNRVQG